jgi:putative ABC transport system permease protein
MNVLTNLVKRNLILNKRRTIVTIASIILSCALIGGVATLVSSFQRFMQDVEIEDSGNYHAIFNNVPKEKVKYIENNAYIKESMKSTTLGYAYLKGSKNTYKPYLWVVAFDKQNFENTPLKLLTGRLPKNSDEIIISSHIESDGGVKYKVGDTIILEMGDRYSGNTKLGTKDPYIYNENVDGVINQDEIFKTRVTHQYKIVGIIERPSFEPYSSAGYTVITYLDSKDSSMVDSLNISVIVKNPSGIYDKLENIAKINDLPKNKNVYDIEYHNALLRWYGITDNDNANSVLYGFEVILITVIMIASVIVIYNSFNISITERKKQFGMLSSIGTTSKQIRNMVLKEGLLLSIIGIPLGIISSIIGIGITLQVINSLGIFEEYYDTQFMLTVSPLSIFITIFFGSLTIFLSCLIPAIKASRTSPIDAIRLTGDIKIKGRKLRTSKLTHKLFGIEGDLALKNMKRNRKKYRSTIISLFVSIVLFMTINAFAEYTFRSTLKVYNNYNFNVGAIATKDILKNIAKFDYIDKYSISSSVDMVVYLDEKRVNSKVISDMKQGSYDTEKQKYIVNVKLSTLGDKEFARYAKEIGVNVNDYMDTNNHKAIMIDKSNFFSARMGKYFQVTLTDIKEKDKLFLYGVDITQNMTIGKITSTYPIGFNNTDGYIGTIQAFITDKVYDSINNSIKSEDTTMFIKSSNPTILTDNIENYAKEKNAIINVQNIDEIVKLMNNAVLAVSIFLYGFITLVSLITITNVINTITTSIYLRRREFAMLKAVGMTNVSFNKMIRFESIFYGFKSLLYGLPLGILLDYFMYKNVSSLYVYDYEIPYRPIFISILFVFVIISITMAYSVRKIKNDNIIDVIKQENL